MYMRQGRSAGVLAALVFLALLTSVSRAEPRDPYVYFFNETWNDFSEELQKARDQGKKAVFVFFEMDECPFCHYMKQNVLNQPEVQAYFRENFLSFSVDIEGDIEVADFAGNTMTQKAFADKNRVRATPVLGFFDLEGGKAARFTGRTAGVEEFMLLGRYVAEGHYKEMPFLKYKRLQRDKANAS